MMRLIRGTTSMALVLILGATSTALGGIETFSHTTPTAAVPFTDTFTLPAFDPALGTLTGITMTLETSVTAEVDVFNSTGSPQTFTNASASIPVTLTGPGGTSATTTTMAIVASGIADPGFNPFAGNLASSTASSSVGPAGFAAYENGATITLGAAFSGGTYSGSSVPGIFFGGSATAGAITTVTYTYTSAVPEPASFGMVCLGISAAWAVRRSRLFV